jgi:hypothetical protein
VLLSLFGYILQKLPPPAHRPSIPPVSLAPGPRSVLELSQCLTHPLLTRPRNLSLDSRPQDARCTALVLHPHCRLPTPVRLASCNPCTLCPPWIVSGKLFLSSRVFFLWCVTIAFPRTIPSRCFAWLERCFPSIPTRRHRPWACPCGNRCRAI